MTKARLSLLLKQREQLISKSMPPPFLTLVQIQLCPSELFMSFVYLQSASICPKYHRHW